MHLPKRCSSLHSWCVLLFLSVWTASGAEESKESFQNNYTKHELEIAMRDGVKLFTFVYIPKETDTTYPILLQRTPYSVKPYTIDDRQRPHDLPDSYVREKFIFALQDV